ncbi:MAG: hypothetical protein ACM3VV_02445 [Deltaproteobacteria bacterium]
MLNLHCNKTDDNDDVDNTKIYETILSVENGRFQGFGPESMANGNDWKVNADIQFNEKAIITLYDDDLIRNLSNIKHIRTHIVEEIEVHHGTKKVSFTLSNANYVLTYEII